MATDIETVPEIDGSTLHGAAQRLRDTLDAPEDTSEAPEEAAETMESTPDEGAGDHEEAPLETADDLDPSGEVVEEADGGEEDYSPTLEPPSAWTGDAKAKWDRLPDDIQEEIVRRGKDADRGVTKRLNEIAEAERDLQAKREEADRSSAEARQRLEGLVSTSEELKLPDISMLDIDSDSFDSDKYHLEKARYDQNKEQRNEKLRELQKDRQEDQKKLEEAQVQSVQASTEKLFTRFPSWRENPERGQKAISELRSYMVEHGVPDQVAAKVYDADMLTFIWKARQYDRARNGGKPASKPKVTRPATRKAASNTSDMKEAEKAFEDNPTDHNAAALLRARRQAK